MYRTTTIPVFTVARRAATSIALLVGLAFLLAPAAASAADLSLDDVLAKHYEAIGGKEAWKNVQSIRSTGQMTMGPMEVPITITAMRPNKMRMEFEMQGMKAIQAYDGESGWQVMPFQGSTEPEPMDEEMVKNLEGEADIEGVLIDSEEKGHEVALVGKEEFEGTDAYKLAVKLAGGREIELFLDAEYFVTIGRKEKTSIPGMGEVEVVSSVSDYKEVGGLMMPHSTSGTSSMGTQTITFSSIEVNQDVDPMIFEMPESKGE